MEDGVVIRRARLVILALAAACGAPPVPAGAPPPTRARPDVQETPASALIPPGYGTLRQDDISIVLESGNVRIAAIPLDESVIRTLAPDSYRGLHAYADDFKRRIAQIASMHGIRDPRVWYVRYDGLASDARFVATDLTVTSGGRDYRPVDVVPISNGFGEGRLQPRETQRGLLVFEDGVDVSQPLAVSIGIVRNVDWDLVAGGILRKLDTERASIRSRAAAHP
ncbi:MAG: hypothetical protein ACREPM_24010 [Gemmatimonadaceae bacterium]